MRTALKNQTYIPGIVVLFILISRLTAVLQAQDARQASGEPKSSKAGTTLKLTLPACLDSAFSNNRFRPASQQGVRVAEAQLKQARSGYWPQVSAQLSAVTMDQDPNFVMPPTPQTLVVPVLGTMNIDLPAQDIKLMDKLNGLAKLEMVYPVYTGGFISSMVRQAESGLQIAKIETQRTDFKIRADVKRMYYGCVLARNLSILADEALIRLETTLQLTENLYQKGSGKVKKTDYLKNKIIVESVRSLAETAKQNENTAQAALMNAMGMTWKGDLEVEDAEIPFETESVAFASLVQKAFESNPDMAKASAGLTALEAKCDQASSGYYPHVALIGNMSHTENKWDYGYVSPKMKDSWLIGIGVKLDIFSGFRTTGEVEEATARMNKLQDERVVLREGIALQIRYYYNKMIEAQNHERTSRSAMETAMENRDLTERAYQNDLLEVKDLIEAQILESFTKARYQKARYDHYETLAMLEQMIGSTISDAQSE